MAKPIQLDIPTRDHKAELQRRLAEAPAEHAAAILDFLDLLETLHQHNVLSTLRGAVGAGDTLVTHLSNGVSRPESVRAIRNFLALTKLFAQMDPELVESVQQSLPAQLKDRHLRQAEPAPGLWTILRTFFSPRVRRALLATGFVLAGVGAYMNRETPGLADHA